MLKHYLHKALTLPPWVTAKKIAGRIKQKGSEAFIRRKDQKACSYAAQFPEGNLFHYFPRLLQGELLPRRETLLGVTRYYLDHRFDLLGAGWVRVHHGMRCRGLERYRYDKGESVVVDAQSNWLKGRINTSNLSESQRIWGFVDSDYIPIDWQIDFKSGYRWSEKTWFKDIKYGHKLGADIKVPWELARMQHLPQLALAYAFGAKGLKIQEEKIKGESDREPEISIGVKSHFEAPELYAREFRNQVLDFIATNPPRFGVNWACTMEVGIRVANCLVAYDIFRAHGMQFDEDFEKAFKRSVYEHGLHIVNNLEWDESFRNNHYLSDIAGLLFVAAYLPCTPETNAWLAFAIQELICETKKQFYEDGGNFESSTSYHRLSGELVFYCTALILGLPPEKIAALGDVNTTGWKVKPALLPLSAQEYKINAAKTAIELPQWFIDRLFKIGRFTVDITKPNGEIPQIGDNDSGRFFRLTPVGKFLTNAEAEKIYLNLKGYNDLIAPYAEKDEAYWDENILDHSTFVGAVAGLFDDGLFSFGKPLEKSLIRNMAKGRLLKPKDTAYSIPRCADSKDFSDQVDLRKYLQSGVPMPVEMGQENLDETTEKASTPTSDLPFSHTTTYQAEQPFTNLRFIPYPESGIFLYKADNLFLSICATPLGQNGAGGHTHNDKLSYDLWLDGRDIARDPGTYLYTPLPDKRNIFRSTKAHNVPMVDNIEQNHWIEGAAGLFGMHQDSECFVKGFGRNFLELVLQFHGIVIDRRFSFRKDSLTITDCCNKELNYNKCELHSNGYGKLSITFQHILNKAYQ